MARGTATRPRFVVHSLGRSGSTLLTDLLAAHPQIECDGEILSHPVLITTPERLVRDRARLFPSKCYGFKMRPRHYDDQHFNDSVHFTDAGSAKQAQRVIERLSTIVELRELAAKR